MANFLTLQLTFAVLLAATPVGNPASSLQAGATEQSRQTREIGALGLSTSYHTNPAVCHDGWSASSDGFIVALEPWADSVGLLRGDRIVSIEEQPVGQDWADRMPRTRAPRGAFTLEVDRAGRTVSLEIPCREHVTYLKAEARMLRTMSEGNWKACIESAEDLVTVFGRPVATPYLAESRCMVAQAAADKTFAQTMAPTYATVLYKFVALQLAEQQFVPDGVERFQADALVYIDEIELQAHSFPRASDYVIDLRHKLAAAIAEGRRLNAGPNKGPARDPEEVSVSGTAFIVDTSGLLLTAYHVVEGATEVAVRCQGEEFRVAIVQSQAPLVDLALLKVSGAQFAARLQFAPSSSATLGQRVMTIGFPAPDLLGTDAKYSEGTVSGTSGPGGDASFLQISVPIQPGNSGGPLLDEAGRVIGIVVSSAAPAAFLKSTGSLPQNVNWAVKSEFARPLLPTLPPASARVVVSVDRARIIANATAAACLVLATRRK